MLNYALVFILSSILIIYFICCTSIQLWHCIKNSLKQYTNGQAVYIPIKSCLLKQIAPLVYKNIHREVDLKVESYLNALEGLLKQKYWFQPPPILILE